VVYSVRFGSANTYHCRAQNTLVGGFVSVPREWPLTQVVEVRNKGAMMSATDLISVDDLNSRPCSGYQRQTSSALFARVRDRVRFPQGDVAETKWVRRVEDCSRIRNCPHPPSRSCQDYYRKSSQPSLNQRPRQTDSPQTRFTISSFQYPRSSGGTPPHPGSSA